MESIDARVQDSAEAPARAVAPPSSPPRASARLPFDPSYPAHLKVLLGSLARSVGAAPKSSTFSDCLYACLDYLIRYWLGANLGALSRAGRSPVSIPTSVPSLEEAIRLLRHSVFAWESMPDQPMRQLIRLGFFEPTSPPQPRLHTRWLALAGDPLPEGIAASDLSRWGVIEDHVMARRVVYLQVLSSFLSASRPLFVKYQRHYLMQDEVLEMELAFEGTGEPFLVTPSLAWDNYGSRMSLVQIQAVESSATLPMGPGPGRPAAVTSQPRPAPELRAESQVQALTIPQNAPPFIQELLRPLHLCLNEWHNGLPKDEAWEEQMRLTAVQVVPAVSETMGVFVALLLGQLRRNGPLPEPLEAGLRSFGEPEQRLKLLHFAWPAALGTNPELAALFVDSQSGPRPHARWMGLPDSLLQGLGRLTFWSRVAAQDPAHGGREDSLHQLREISLCLSSCLEALASLWGDGSQAASWGRREDGCITGLLWSGGQWVSMDEGLPEESPPELAPREPRPLSEVIQDLQLLQQRGNAPYFLVEGICEFVSSPGSGSGMVVWGVKGSGKSFLMTHLLEEQRQLLAPISASVSSCDCSWVLSDDSRDFLLESLNEALAFHRWRGDCDWEPLAPPALADLYQRVPLKGEGDLSTAEVPLKAFLHRLWTRNQPRSNTQKVAFLLDELRDEEARPWSATAMPAHFAWVASSDHQPPVCTAAFPPAYLPVFTHDSPYKRFLVEHLSGVFGGERESWSGVASRAQAMDEARLLAGLLSRGLVRKPEQLPSLANLFPFLLSRLRLNQEQKRFLAFLAEGAAIPTALLVASGFEEREVSLLIDLFPWLFLLREENVGRLQEDWEERLSFLTLAHPGYSEALKLHLPIDGKAVVAAVVDHLAGVISRAPAWPTGLDFLTFLTWARLAQNFSRDLGWKLLSLEGIRKRRETVCESFERQRRLHRKVMVLSRWIEFLDSLKLEDCPEGLEVLLADTLLEERLWAFSSRALTFRSMGRLDEALADIEHSIEEFRKAVVGNSSLLNGLAAAHNRRSEILRELGRYDEALSDAHEAVAAYERVLVHSDRAHLEPLLALALHNRGGVLQELGLLEQAEADMERALERYRPWQEKLHSRVRLDLARALRERGRLALLREDPIQSRDDSTRVLQLLERFREDWAELRVERALAQHQLAEAYLAIEEEKRALEASDRAAEIWESLVQEGRLDLRAIFAQELNHRAQLLLHLGKVDEAAATVQIAADLHMQLVEDEGRRDLYEHLSRSMLLRGRVLQRSGKWEAAKQEYSEACRYLEMPGGKVAGSNGYRRQTRDALVETGVYLTGLHFQLGEYESAVCQARITLALLEGEVAASVQTLEKKARLLDLLGRSLLQQGQLTDEDAALGAHDSAVEVLSELVDVQGHYHLLPRLAEAYLGRARTRRYLGQEQAALEDANMAVELLAFLSEKGGDPGVLALLGPARLEAAELLWSLGQGERAFEHVQDALSDFELYGEEGQTPGQHKAAPLLLRGKLHLAAGRTSEAMQDFLLALEGLHELQQRGWDVDAQIEECSLLQVQAAAPSPPPPVAEAVPVASDEAPVLCENWESTEKLLRRVFAEARAHLGECRFEEARACYTQLLEVLKKAEAHAAPGYLQPYRIKTHHERALLYVQQGFGGALSVADMAERWQEAQADLSIALRLAALSAGSLPGWQGGERESGSEGGREELLMLAHVYETRVEFGLQPVPGLVQCQQGREAAVADLGRAIEALLEIIPSEASIQEHLISLYERRRQLACELGDCAGEWRDLCHLRALLRDSIVSGEGQNLRALIKVVSRRAQALESMDLLVPAQDEGRECLRLLSQLRLQSRGDEGQYVALQMVQLHLNLATPRGRRSWEDDSYDLVTHLCEAVDLVFSCTDPDGEGGVSPWSWIPLEQLRAAFEHAVPLSTAKLAHNLLRVYAQRDGSEAWGEVLPLVLKQSSWDDLPHPLSTAFLARWASWAGETDAPWVGEAFRILAELPLRRLKEDAEATKSLRYCLESWCALPNHQLTRMGVPHERLEVIAAELIALDRGPVL